MKELGCRRTPSSPFLGELFVCRVSALAMLVFLRNQGSRFSMGVCTLHVLLSVPPCMYTTMHPSALTLLWLGLLFLATWRNLNGQLKVSRSRNLQCLPEKGPQVDHHAYHPLVKLSQRVHYMCAFLTIPGHCIPDGQSVHTAGMGMCTSV